MNAFRLEGKTSDGRTGVLFGCGTCLIAHRDEQTAAMCCAKERCSACGDELERRDQRWHNNKCYCEPCVNLERAQIHDSRIAAAPRRAESAAEMLYCDCCEHYCSDSHEMLDDHYHHERDLPEYAWACDPVYFELDAGSLIDSALSDQEFHEDAGFDSFATRELQEALDAWCKKHRLESYFPSNEVVDLTTAREEYLAASKVELALDDKKETPA